MLEIGNYVRHYFLHEANGFTYKDGIIVDVMKHQIHSLTEYKVLFYVSEETGTYTSTQIEEEFEVISQ